MPSIEELLRKTLEGATPQYEEADQDLHAEVRDASAAVQNITGGLAKLLLVPDEDLPDATVYRLVLAMGDEQRDLKAFAIPFLGYPILVSDKVQELKEVHGQLGRGTLHPVFEQMASQRESPLVKLLAYILRNREALSALDPQEGAINGA